MRVTLIAIACLAACAGRTIPIDGTGDSLDGGAPVDLARPIDLARSFDFSSPIDLAQPLGNCADLLTCTNSCTTQTCVDQCLAMSTPVAQKLFTIVSDCANNACGMACNDPSSKACNDCFYEVSTGTAADGQSGGPCVDSAMNPSMSPNCGLCVDQLLACADDTSM